MVQSRIAPAPISRGMSVRKLPRASYDEIEGVCNHYLAKTGGAYDGPASRAVFDLAHEVKALLAPAQEEVGFHTRSGRLVVRSGGFYTVQACFFKDKETPRQSKAMLSWLAGLNVESIIDVRGELVEAQVNSCSQGNVELAIREVRLVSASLPQLPFELEDASRSEEEVTASEA